MRWLRTADRGWGKSDIQSGNLVNRLSLWPIDREETLLQNRCKSRDELASPAMLKSRRAIGPKPSSLWEQGFMMTAEAAKVIPSRVSAAEEMMTQRWHRAFPNLSVNAPFRIHGGPTLGLHSLETQIHSFKKTNRIPLTRDHELARLGCAAIL